MNKKLLPSSLTGLGAITMLVSMLGLSAAQAPAAQRNDAPLFSALVPVLRHPRCLNCHASGDFPRQGDDGHQHAMNVRRGATGLGVTAEKCTTCHQDHNLAGLHMPPGAPGWRLPPAATPMVWQGRTDGEICRQIKDPKQNGHKSLEQIVDHMTRDKLVAWAWHPGEGRNPIPMSQDEFSVKVKSWAAAGAPCPR